jgi:3-hydroxyisobutyrate dehydrogenase-like beta-hydroxyacid dehydrogenase
MMSPKATEEVVGVLHPGEMGAAVGTTLTARAVDVRWVPVGRSESTRRRAEQAGLRPSPTLQDLVEQSQVILSICPPAEAVTVATEVGRLGFRGVYVDANAIAPSTAEQISAVMHAVGASFVDASIIGPPPADGRQTTVYLSGPGAPTVADLLAGSDQLVVRTLGTTSTTAASALKMCYAAWTKGTQALLLAIRGAACAHDVDDALVDEWSRSQPALVARCEAAARSAPKAWRWSAEMHEVAVTFTSAGLPSGFSTAAAEIFDRLSGFKDEHPGLDEVLASLAPGSSAQA